MNKYNSTTKIISNSHSITFHLNFSNFIFVSLLLFSNGRSRKSIPGYTQTNILSGDGEMWNSNSKCSTLKDGTPYTHLNPEVYVSSI